MAAMPGKEAGSFRVDDSKILKKQGALFYN